MTSRHEARTPAVTGLFALSWDAPMKRLSAKALRHVDELYRLDRQSGWFGRGRVQSAIIEHLTDLSDCGELASIVCVFNFLLCKDRNVRRAAQSVVDGIFAKLSPLEHLQLPGVSWWDCRWSIGPEWLNLQSSRVRTLAETAEGDTSVATLGLLSFHHSGYVREEAVMQLSEVADGTELAFLLIRQNDWVEQVSSLARAAIQNRLKSGSLQHFADNIDLVAHLPEFGRHELLGVADDVYGQFLSPDNEEILRSQIRNGLRATTRKLVKRGFELPGGHHSRLARLGIDSRDVVVRLWSARHLLKLDNEFPSHLLNDTFPPLRRLAYEAKAASDTDGMAELWRQAACDPSAGIRDLARYHLRTLGVDVQRFYRNKLAANPDNWPAFAGLSECATQDDVDVLRASLSHRYPKYRSKAVKGMASVFGIRYLDELLPRLTDESPSVVRQAARYLRDLAGDIDGARLFSTLERSQTKAAQVEILRLIREMGKWKSLPWLLRATDLGDAFLKEQASEFAVAWLVSNRVFTRPTPAEQREIQRAYQEVSRVIPPSLDHQLRRALPFALGETQNRPNRNRDG